MAYDPDAVYNQTAADVALQEGWEEGGLTEQEGNLKATTGYQESEVSRAEPGAYRGESNAANRGGVLTSGINAHRKATIAGGFAARRIANQLALTQGQARIQREREGGRLKRTERLHTAGTLRAAQKDEIAKANAAALAEQERIHRETDQPTAPAPYSPPGTPPIPAGAKPPPGMEFNNGLTVPIGTKVYRPRKR